MDQGRTISKFIYNKMEAKKEAKKMEAKKVRRNAENHINKVQ